MEGEEEPTTLGWWDGIYLKKDDVLQLPDYQMEGYTLKWTGMDDADAQYKYDPVRHTLTFDQVEDGGMVSLYLYACYIKDEE